MMMAPAIKAKMSVAPLRPHGKKGKRTRPHVSCSSSPSTSTSTPTTSSTSRSPVTPEYVRAAARSQPWKMGLEPAGEFNDVASVQIKGTIPDDLIGRAIYAAGPGRIRLEGADCNERYGHWFDGDGSVMAVRFEGPDAASVSHRMVAGERLQEQNALGEGKGMATRGFWTDAGGGWLRNVGRQPSNPRNTAVTVLNGKLLVLCEGGLPAEMDPQTLETVALDAVPPGLEPGCFLSAHGKHDAKTGEYFTFGARLVGPPALDVVRVGADGRVAAQTTVSLGGNIVFVHDFAVTENHIVILIPPWVCAFSELLPSILFEGPLGHRFRYDASLGTKAIVLKRDTLEVVGEAVCDNAFSFYHVANAFEEPAASGDGVTLRVTLAQQRDADRPGLERQFANMYDAEFDPGHHADLWEHELHVSAANDSVRFVSRRAVCEGSASGALALEFPFVNPANAMRKARYAYAVGRSDAPVGGERPTTPSYFDRIQKVDLEHGTSEVHSIPSGQYANEPLFVASSSASREDDGYLLCPLYDATSHELVVRVLDARNVSADAICEVRFDRHVPFRFHGYVV
uniref:carotenoid 9,10-dioxygenase n=1 Tax=Pycnococcus provasolii TaxID=41880 RepID=A0A7S2YUY1_9CHLO|mmetsp:Transcript_1207/g.2913  ORF Transcript_1207/g.2913 Transcript_1207/m.2913 type:complete len:569 (+) Transcript_1207:50-1756(+)